MGTVFFGFEEALDLLDGASWAVAHNNVGSCLKSHGDLMTPSASKRVDLDQNFADAIIRRQFS